VSRDNPQNEEIANFQKAEQPLREAEQTASDHPQDQTIRAEALRAETIMRAQINQINDQHRKPAAINQFMAALTKADEQAHHVPVVQFVSGHLEIKPSQGIVYDESEARAKAALDAQRGESQALGTTSGSIEQMRELLDLPKATGKEIAEFQKEAKELQAATYNLFLAESIKNGYDIETAKANLVPLLREINGKGAEHVGSLVRLLQDVYTLEFNNLDGAHGALKPDSDTGLLTLKSDDELNLWCKHVEEKLAGP
jgi:hypothetical protein